MKKNFIEYAMITIGVLIVALSIHLFMIPNNFVVGGISGLAIVLNRQMPQFSVGLIMNLLNLTLFLIGFLTLGKHFGTKTLYSSFLLSGFVWYLDAVYPINGPLIEDRFIQLLMCIVSSAIGLALVFRHKASTGGTDITANILNKYLHIDLGKGVLISDLFVTLFAAFTFDLETVFYGIVGIFLNGMIIDFVLNKFKEAREVRIITDDLEHIKDFIMNELVKGATIYSGYGAYTNQKRSIITTILNRQEYVKLKIYIRDSKIDAFITVTHINETFGLGFESLSE